MGIDGAVTLWATHFFPTARKRVVNANGHPVATLKDLALINRLGFHGQRVRYAPNACQQGGVSN